MAKPILASINTLTGVVRVDKNEILGTGSYGQVFAVKHEGKTYAAKQIHSVLLEAEEEQAVRDNFIKECYHSVVNFVTLTHRAIHWSVLAGWFEFPLAEYGHGVDGY